MSLSYRRSRRGAGRPVCLVWTLFLVGVLAASGGEVEAQITLAWPDTAFNENHHRTLRSCMAAVSRVIDGEQKRERTATRVWRDTLPYDLSVEGPGQPLPGRAAAIAGRCMVRFKALTERIDTLAAYRGYWGTLRLLMRGALAANQDAEAAALITKAIETAPEARDWFEQMAIAEYKDARPRRIAALDSLIMSRMSEGASLDERYGKHRHLTDLAMSVGDTAMAWRHLEKVATLWPEFSAGYRQAVLAPELNKHMVAAVAYSYLHDFYHRALVDTLRQHGTARYLAARRALFTRSAGVAPEGLPNITKLDEFHKLVGQQAPPVVGDFWFRRGDSAASRPTRGRVGLLVFIDPTPPGEFGASAGDTDSVPNFSDCFPKRNTREELEASFQNRADDRHEKPLCWQIPAVLRRLAQRFPALEITVMTQTYGPIVYTAYPKEPATQAELLRHWWHDVHRAPGALAVTATSHVYLPEPDGQIRFQRKTPNTDNYFSGIGQSWADKIRTIFGNIIYGSVMHNGTAFLVDRAGIIVKAAEIRRGGEAGWADVIDALLSRSKARATP